jgi:hypothetical protein
MATSINFGAPELGFGSFGVAKCQVEIQENGVAISTRLYYFNVNEFCAFVDTTAVNYASVHFGQHVINISNGDYDTIYYNGGSVANPYLAIYALAEEVAQLAP